MAASGSSKAKHTAKESSGEEQYGGEEDLRTLVETAGEDEKL